jgi:hypothetical protein
VAGDFSPLTIEVNHGTRAAPPALVVAMAVGLGSMDMPVPSVEEWEWLNWKFPRPIHAGDTIFARWTLTQKRPPVGGAPSAIVVWRVDVHTVDGTLCAEGEVGAKVRRDSAGRPRAHAASPSIDAAVSPAPTSPSRRRRRRRGSNGSTTVPETPAVAAPPAPAAKPERAAGASRRRRRRRPSGQGARSEEHEPRAAHAPETAAAPAPASIPESKPGERGTLSRVIRRLRRT